MLLLLLQSAEPDTIKEALIYSIGLIIIAVGGYFAQCVVRHLERLEGKLDRNTRETVRTRVKVESKVNKEPATKTAGDRRSSNKESANES
jgi:hypothetical protein